LPAEVHRIAGGAAREEVVDAINGSLFFVVRALRLAAGVGLSLPAAEVQGAAQIGQLSSELLKLLFRHKRFRERCLNAGRVRLLPSAYCFLKRILNRASLLFPERADL
jgi:hypothetical protein